MDAEELGLQLEEEGPRRKYDLDKEEEQMVRHEVKKRTEMIKNQPIKKEREDSSTKWKKNKLVLSLDQIKKML